MAEARKDLVAIDTNRPGWDRHRAAGQRAPSAGGNSGLRTVTYCFLTEPHFELHLDSDGSDGVSPHSNAGPKKMTTLLYARSNLRGLSCLLALLCFEPALALAQQPPHRYSPTITDRSEIASKDPPSSGNSGNVSPEQKMFWRSLSGHCGKAFNGSLAHASDHYRASLSGRVAVIHFFDCDNDRIHIALHLDADRSRNLILTRTGGTLRLKHDHRTKSGEEDRISQYGGDARAPGLPSRQIFWADAHTAALLPERSDNFWFLDLTEHDKLQYGVHWPTRGHSAQFEFDLSKPVNPPPAPWGW